MCGKGINPVAVLAAFLVYCQEEQIRFLRENT